MKRIILLLSGRGASIIILIFIAVFSLMSCGGGGGSDKSSPTPTPTADTPVLINQSASGIWQGTFHSNVTQETYQVTGIASENGEVRFIADTGSQYNGTVNVSGSIFSGTVRAYAAAGVVFPDGSQLGNVSISGTVQTKTYISGSYFGVGDTGNFYLTYSSLYDRDSSISLIAGAWSGGINDVFLSILIQNDGSFSGIDSTGCVYSGFVSIINPAYNTYRINVSVSSCGLFSGSYSGLATLSDFASPNDTLIYGVSNNTLSAVGLFTR